MSDDLVTRLRHAWDERERQLDEDERVARGLSQPWLALTMHPDRGEVVSRPDGEGVARTPDHRMAEHIARHDPARVLAEVERGRRDIAAKRRILEDYQIVVSAIRRVDDMDGNRLLYERRDTLAGVVRQLAEAEGLV